MLFRSLHLYMEDTYEVDGHPYFGHLRGKYSKAELREIDAYAAAHGMQVIPCIQTLAHVNALFHWPVYREIHDAADILLTGDERTYELVDGMFRTLRECLRTNIVNIGMDEADLLGLGKYLTLHGLSLIHISRRSARTHPCRRGTRPTSGVRSRRP